MLKNKLIISLLTLISIITPTSVKGEFDQYLGYTKNSLTNMTELWQECYAPLPENPINKGILSNVSYKGSLTPGEEFTIKVRILNTGNTTWFGDASKCYQKNFFRLGTSRSTDRISPLWQNFEDLKTTLPELKNQGWISGNRIKLTQKYVKPGQLGTFEYKAIAPWQEDLYIEYFTPLIENTTWLSDLDIPIRLHVGAINDEQRNKGFFMTKSGGSKKLDLSKKNILVDISSQKAHLRIGEQDIFTFPISSGKSSTPTPVEKTQIYRKQKVRIGGKAPHYIMPLYHSLRSNGAYGFHSLPSLGNDRGIFWSEALSHIGIPVSHGCIRLLPQDAQTLWDFSNIGTPVTIQW